MLFAEYKQQPVSSPQIQNVTAMAEQETNNKIALGKLE